MALPDDHFLRKWSLPEVPPPPPQSGSAHAQPEVTSSPPPSLVKRAPIAGWRESAFQHHPGFTTASGGSAMLPNYVSVSVTVAQSVSVTVHFAKRSR